MRRFLSGRSKKSPANATGGAVEPTLSDWIGSLSVQEEETLIAIVGITGSGKSSFIKRVTKQDDIKIGEGLCSMTQEVKEYRYTVAGKTFVLIDTPGFDDTEVDDEDIFEALVDWLEKSYRKGQRLTGLLYLHRIISNREKGSDLRNLRVFQKLCGDRSFSNVVIGITWWDKEDPEVADSREKVLRESDEFWGGMITKGAQVVRVPLDEQGCIGLLMDISKRRTTTLDVQDEVVNQGKDAKHTNAATALVNYDRSQAQQDSDLLDELAHKIRMKTQLLRQQQDAAQRQAIERARYEEEQERRVKEAEEMLKQKREEALRRFEEDRLRLEAEEEEFERQRNLEAEEFRQRDEARRRRLEDLERQIRATQGENEDDDNNGAGLAASPISSPSSYHTSNPFRQSSTPSLIDIGSNPEMGFTLPRLEREEAARRRRESEQRERREREERGRREQEKRDEEYARRVAAEARAAEEQQERMKRAIETEKQRLADMVAQALARAVQSREVEAMKTRNLKHQDSILYGMTIFAMYQPYTMMSLRQSWRGCSYPIDGVQTAGPLQSGFCADCMCPLPLAEGHWECHRCLYSNGAHYAVCNDCKARRPVACFDASHTLTFTSWSDEFRHGPFATCVRLNRRYLPGGMVCSLCRVELLTLFFHCCGCDNDDFDMCFNCWGRQFRRCRVPHHTLYLHAWTPPTNRWLPAAP